MHTQGKLAVVVGPTIPVGLWRQNWKARFGEWLQHGEYVSGMLVLLVLLLLVLLLLLLQTRYFGVRGSHEPNILARFPKSFG